MTKKRARTTSVKHGDVPTKNAVFYLNKELRASIDDRLNEEGVTLGRRAAWLKRALVNFAADDPVYSGVGRQEKGRQMDVRMGVSLDEEFQDRLNIAYRVVRVSWPDAGHLFSMVMRAAVRHELQNCPPSQTLSIIVPAPQVATVARSLILALGGKIDERVDLTDVDSVDRQLDGLVRAVVEQERLKEAIAAVTSPKASVS